MLDNEKMFKLSNTQSLVSMAEPSDAFREEKPHLSSALPFPSSILLWTFSSIQRTVP